MKYGTLRRADERASSDLQGAAAPVVISARQEGTAGDDVLTGTTGDDELFGRGGNDVLDGLAGQDTLTGGGGNDRYIVDRPGDLVVELSGNGSDVVASSVTYTLPDNVEKLELTGTVAINGIGNDLANVIVGNAAANTLNGQGGADVMEGGLGNDTYIVDHSKDRAVELAGGGTDLVVSSINFALDDNVEQLRLAGSASINGTGNALVNTISGNGGSNRIDGGAGADTLNGRGGNDTYVVDDVDDKVKELEFNGIDTVESSVNYTLAQYVENLTLTGTAAQGRGNGSANIIVGNAANNQLRGAGGADTLEGGAGTDTLRGEAGDDTYIIKEAHDIVIEATGQGTDLVKAQVSYSLEGEAIENMELTGSAAINGRGNGLVNEISGNGAANKINGEAGNDLLNGAGGGDTLIGGAGDDELRGGEGKDVLDGGSGKDGFYFDTALDAGNVDQIQFFKVADDTIFLERTIFAEVKTGAALADYAFQEGTKAQDWDDRIIYDQDSGKIYYDADGKGSVSAILFARVAEGTVLTHADFATYTG